MPDFSREVSTVEDTHVVSLRGELDIVTADGLADWLVDISGSTVVVDLSRLTFMDSSGITAMVIARNRMAETGDELILTRPHAIVRRALEAVGLAHWITAWDPTWCSVGDQAAQAPVRLEPGRGLGPVGST